MSDTMVERLAKRWREGGKTNAWLDDEAHASWWLRAIAEELESEAERLRAGGNFTRQARGIMREVHRLRTEADR